MAYPNAYDTSKALAQNTDYDSPGTLNRISTCNCESEESYDVPRSMTSQNISNHETFPTINNPRSLNYSLSICSSHYDVPKKLSVNSHSQDQSQQSFVYDVPASQQNYPSTMRHQLGISSALGTLTRLESVIIAAATRLAEFVTPGWRSENKLKLTLTDMKLSVNQLVLGFDNFINFCRSTIENMSNVDDKRLFMKLNALLQSITEASKTINGLANNIELNGWTVENLVLWDENSDLNDNLNQLIACVRSLIDESQITTVSSIIQGNAALLFNQKPLNINDLGLIEKNQRTHDITPKLVETNSVANDISERPLLIFYGTQIVGHIKYICAAVDSFLQSVERNQPPKQFLTHGKLVILSAFNIINTGDMIYRNTLNADLMMRISNCTTSLSDAIKNFVAKTKRAAQHFPSVIAVQEMVDTVVKVSHSAFELRLIILQELNS